jgi:MFS family permease
MVNNSRLTMRKGHSLRTFEAFGNRSYRFLWPANFLAYICRWMQLTLLGWLVLELTDSPFSVALVGFFGMLPLLILGMVGGVLADRVNKHRILVMTQVVSCVAAFAMVLLLKTGAIRFWHAYVVMGCTGVGWALDMPSRRSAIHDLVGRAGVTNAIAMDSVGMQASRMIGPALAGALITTVDVVGGYIVVSAIYVVAIALIAVVSLPPSDRSRLGLSNVLDNLVEGFRYVKRDNALVATVLVTILMNLLLFPYAQMIPVIARDVLLIGPGLMGTLLGAEGLGALFGAICVASRGVIRFHGRLYIGGSMLGLVMLLCFSMVRWYYVALPVLFVLGFGTSGFSTMQSTLVMLRAREEMRGRALGIISLAIGAGPIGALMVGAIASMSSTPFAIGFDAVLGIVLLSSVALLMPSLWRQPMISDEPAPEVD